MYLYTGSLHHLENCFWFLMRVHSRWLVAICERTNIYIIHIIFIYILYILHVQMLLFIFNFLPLPLSSSFLLSEKSPVSVSWCGLLFCPVLYILSTVANLSLFLLSFVNSGGPTLNGVELFPGMLRHFSTSASPASPLHWCCCGRPPAAEPASQACVCLCVEEGTCTLCNATHPSLWSVWDCSESEYVNIELYLVK